MHRIVSDPRLMALTLVAALALPLLAPAFALAQAPSAPTALLTGTVTDAEGKPIPGAYVKAQGLASAKPGQALSTESGEYTVYALAPGYYDVTVLKQGFAQATARIVVIDKEVARLDFELIAGATQVAAPQTAGKGIPREASTTPYHEHVVSTSDIEQKRPASTTGSLRQAPHTELAGANPHSQVPSVSGAGPSRTLTLVDGDRLSTMRVKVSPSVVDPSNVASAEVVVGSQASLYGSGASGAVVNVTTPRLTPRDRYELDLHFDGTYGSNGRNRNGTVALFLSGPELAVRAAGTLFRQRNYDAGAEAIALSEVVDVARFSSLLGNSAATFPVFDFLAGEQVPNLAGHGSNGQLDVWVFASPKHSFRYQQIDDRSRDLGEPFVTTPYSGIRAGFGYRNLSKYSARYEGDDLTPWLQQVTASFYVLDVELEQSELGFLILPGSSYVFAPNAPAPVAVLTGNASAFTLGRTTSNAIDVVDYGVDAKAIFAPHKDLLVTAGYSYLRESSEDAFSSVALSPFAEAPTIALVPDARATNHAAYAIVEFNRLKRVHLTGGVRVDHWTSEAHTATLPAGAAVPGVSPGATARSATTKASGNLGASFPLGKGFTPYVRVASSFREPSLDERYRAFFTASPLKTAATGEGGSELEPESGFDVEGGLTYQRTGLSATAGVYRNQIRDYIYGDLLPLNGAAIGPDAPLAKLAEESSPTLPRTDVLLYGVHGSFSYSRPLGKGGAHGSVTPYGYVSWEHGTNQKPLPVQLLVVRSFYGRSNTPVKLEGSEDDVPQIGVIPFIGAFGARYMDRYARWSLEYDVRYETRLTRVDPLTFYAGAGVGYATFANLAPFTVQAVRGSYTHQGESYRAVISLGVENLADRFYFEHFQAAPAPGRSFTVGLTLDFNGLTFR